MSKLAQSEQKPFKVATYSDERGSLSVLEFGEISITPKRIFWVNNVPVGVKRAAHFHRRCNQILICTQGGVNVKITNSSLEIQEFSLDVSHAFILQANNLVEYSFQSEGTQLLVLADQAYDPTDVYTIYDWNEVSR